MFGLFIETLPGVSPTYKNSIYFDTGTIEMAMAFAQSLRALDFDLEPLDWQEPEHPQEFVATAGGYKFTALWGT